MAHPGAYRGNKRQKELKRLQKQEEKRKKRVMKKDGTWVPEGEEGEFSPAEALPPEGEAASETLPAAESEAPPAPPETEST